MIKLQSKVKIIDNSGGIIGQCIRILKPKKSSTAKVGDLILVSVKKQRVGSKIKKGDVHRAILVRTKRTNVGNIVFEDNAVILVKDTPDITPIGNRLKGPISGIFKKKQGGQKLILLAKYII